MMRMSFVPEHETRFLRSFDDCSPFGLSIGEGAKAAWVAYYLRIILIKQLYCILYMYWFHFGSDACSWITLHYIVILVSTMCYHYDSKYGNGVDSCWCSKLLYYLSFSFVHFTSTLCSANSNVFKMWTLNISPQMTAYLKICCQNVIKQLDNNPIKQTSTL